MGLILPQRGIDLHQQFGERIVDSQFSKGVSGTEVMSAMERHMHGTEACSHQLRLGLLKCPRWRNIISFKCVCDVVQSKAGTGALLLPDAYR